MASPAKTRRRIEAVVDDDAKTPVDIQDPKFLAELAATLAEVGGGESAGQVLSLGGPSIDIRGVISTQCPTVDAAIGRGGIPLGRLTILHGKEASGKTTLALHYVAECQRMGGLVVYIDKEYKLDPVYATRIGVKLYQQFILSQPEHLEQVFAVVQGAIGIAKMIREKSGVRVPVLIVLDSINAATPKALNLADFEDNARVGAMAAKWSMSLPRIVKDMSKEDVSFLAVSQVRQKIGVMYGPKDDIAGGNAPKFYAALILEVKRTGSLIKSKSGKVAATEGEDDSDKEIVGNLSEVYVKKNGISMPFRRAEFEIIFGEGINYYSSLLGRAKELGVVVLAGAWYSFNGNQIGQGAAQAVASMREDRELCELIQLAVNKLERWNVPLRGSPTVPIPDPSVDLDEMTEANKAAFDSMKSAIAREKAAEAEHEVVRDPPPVTPAARRDAKVRAEELRAANKVRAAHKAKPLPMAAPAKTLLAPAAAKAAVKAKVKA